MPPLFLMLIGINSSKRLRSRHLKPRLCTSLSCTTCFFTPPSDSSIPLSSPMSASELNSSHSTSISDEQVDTAISSPTLDIVNQNNSGIHPSPYLLIPNTHLTRP